MTHGNKGIVKGVMVNEYVYMSEHKKRPYDLPKYSQWMYILQTE